MLRDVDGVENVMKVVGCAELVVGGGGGGATGLGVVSIGAGVARVVTILGEGTVAT